MSWTSSLGGGRPMNAWDNPRPRIIFWDLDSTIADTRQRWHLINTEDRDSTDWRAYSMACVDDEPNEGVITLMRLLYQFGFLNVILSGRDEDARDLTTEWLQKHDVPHVDLLLRKRPDHESYGRNAEYKARRIQEWCKDMGLRLDKHVYLMVDDWPDVEPAMKEIGIPTLVVRAPGLETVEGDASKKQAEDLKDEREVVG